MVYDMFKCSIALICLIWFPSTYAHKVNLFATLEGNLIKGYGYFPGGGRVQQVKVQLLDSKGTFIGETTTDEQGRFEYPITRQGDYTLVLDIGDGHRTHFTVTSPSSEKIEISPPLQKEGGSDLRQSIDCKTELRELLEQAIKQHLTPLREQIDAYEQHIRLHDILGGIGYIFGIMGFYLMIKKSLK